MARTDNTSRMQIPRGIPNQSGQQSGSFPPLAQDTGQWKMPDESEHFGRINYGTGFSGKGIKPQSDGAANWGGSGSGGAGKTPAGQGGFDMGSPRRGSTKKKILIGAAVFLAVIVALVGADFALNNGKVHYGVKVEGIDIGGMTKSEATAELQEKLDSKLAATTVEAKPDAAAEGRLASRAVSGEPASGTTSSETASGSAATDGMSDAPSSFSWVFTAAEIGASVDAASLVDEAYEIGQFNDALGFFPALAERFSSWTGQVDLPAEVAFDAASLSSALVPINEVLGVQMVNSDISVDGEGNAYVMSGQIGEKVNEGAFASLAGPVLLGDSTQAVSVPLSPIPLDIDDKEAQAVADSVNDAISDPVTFGYEGNYWMVWSPMLGSWLTTNVEGSGDATKLVASIDTTLAYDGLQQLMGDVGYGSAQNAHIDVSSGTPVIVGGTSGNGPDIRTGIDELQDILFGSNPSREVSLATAEVEPEVTAEDVASMGVVELINTYQLGYGSGGGSNREFNIERCLDTLNGSLVAPGEKWNWNDVVGLCDESTGYKEAGAIDENNEIVQEPGGGICNVATGVFNAAYEAGLPILERANHSQYMSNYPEGRDAAVSWTYPTLVFQNDTERYILITARYDGTNMFISIWGTSPHRTVESRNSEWADTADGGRTITNYRTVRSADGLVWIDDSFYSYFPPEKEK